MRQFNLEEAKAGKPVQTKEGDDVRLLCFDRHNQEYPLIGLIQLEDGDEEIKTYTSEGKVLAECESDSDLFMKPDIKERWINLYWDDALQAHCPGAVAFISEEKAKEGISPYKNHVATVKVAWED